MNGGLIKNNILSVIPVFLICLLDQSKENPLKSYGMNHYLCGEDFMYLPLWLLHIPVNVKVFQIVRIIGVNQLFYSFYLTEKCDAF
jgi:hypothetical protein